MTELYQTADFDFQIGEILLIHKNIHIHNFRWTAYRAGRGMDGLVFCISGRAAYHFGGEVFTIEAGQMMYLPRNFAYTLQCESEEPFVHFTANFRLSEVIAPADSAVRQIIDGMMRHVTAPASAELYSELFERLLNVWQGKRAGWMVMAKAMLYELLCLYFIDVCRIRNAGEDARLSPAKRELDGGSELGVGELAELCGMSETHFRRLFGRVYGVSPAEYRMNRRILRAKDLLISGQYSVTEAAHAAGFSDISYFAKVFRRFTGTSPREFMNG